jgi:ArsR family transcriptional regulator
MNANGGTLGQSAADRIDPEEFARVAKALGHPARVAIVDHLARIDRCVCGGIVEKVPLAQSTVSQHLKVLKNAGVVRGEVDGPRICYCLDWEVLERFKSAVAELKPEESNVEGL